MMSQMIPIQDIPLNVHGVAQYPKGHTGRLLVVLAALMKLERPTAQSVADYTGLSKGNVDRYVERVQSELGARIRKDGPVYFVESVGGIINPEGLSKVLAGSVKQNYDGDI